MENYGKNRNNYGIMRWAEQKQQSHRRTGQDSRHTEIERLLAKLRDYRQHNKERDRLQTARTIMKFQPSCETSRHHERKTEGWERGVD